MRTEITTPENIRRFSVKALWVEREAAIRELLNFVDDCRDSYHNVTCRKWRPEFEGDHAPFTVVREGVVFCSTEYSENGKDHLLYSVEVDCN